MKYLIVCNLRGDVVEYHKSLVLEIADNFGVQKPLKQKFDPHFTLKYGFYAENLNELESKIEKFCQSVIKTTVLVGGFGNFRKDVIFLNVQLSDEAHNIFFNFIDELQLIKWMTWESVEGKNLHFHATIASHCSEKFAEIIKFINGKDKMFNCYFDNITILKESVVIDGITTWEKYRTYEIN